MKEQAWIRLKDISEMKRVLNNKVLVKTHYKSTDARTEGGIYKIAPSETDWRPADHTNRISEVVLTPDSLFYSEVTKDWNSMPWDTDMELQKGDLVWHDFLAAHNCPIATTDQQPDEEYKLLPYQDIYLVKRGEEFICLNGFVLCEEVFDEPTKFETAKKLNPKFGKVAYLGKPNRAYRQSKSSDDNIDIKVGDVIIKRKKDIHILLESADHQQLDKPLFIIQRRDIFGILE